jgi:hypothetical protein
MGEEKDAGRAGCRLVKAGAEVTLGLDVGLPHEVEAVDLWHAARHPTW